MGRNHVIPPTFFYESIELFSFNYDWYVVSEKTVDEFGREKTIYDKQIIRGSLQPQQSNKKFSNSGNTTQQSYNFYCKAIYRINIGDFIYYNNMYLHVDGVQPYDEYGGVRVCYLTMSNINTCRDLEEYIKFLDGEEHI